MKPSAKSQVFFVLDERAGDYDGLTSGEIGELAHKEFGDYSIETYRKRVSELYRARLLKKIGRRKCRAVPSERRVTVFARSAKKAPKRLLVVS